MLKFLFSVQLCLHHNLPLFRVKIYHHLLKSLVKSFSQERRFIHLVQNYVFRHKDLLKFLSADNLDFSRVHRHKLKHLHFLDYIVIQEEASFVNHLIS